MVRQLYPAGDAEIFMSHIMRVFDTDGNNYLDFKEFLMAMDISNCQTSEPLHPILITTPAVYMLHIALQPRQN